MARRRKKKRQFFDDDASPTKGAHLPAGLLANIETWAKEAVDTKDLEFFDVDVTIKSRWIVRVYVDNPGPTEPGEGVNVDECAGVSRYIEAYLDASDDVPDNYVLEVSSPGIERELTRARHLRDAVGERVQLIVREQVDGKNKVIGELVAYEDSTLTVRLDQGPSEPIGIEWADVKEARLKHDFDF